MLLSVTSTYSEEGIKWSATIGSNNQKWLSLYETTVDVRH
jgi:hypothetical protein